MSLTLYWGSGSPYSWRVLLALAVKKIPFESKQLQFSKREHKSPEFLALNPRGKVPVLVDGERVITESVAMMNYLDAKFPREPIYGRSPEERASVWETISEHDAYLAPAAFKVLRPLLFGHGASKSESIEGYAEVVDEELARLNAKLEGKRWFVGEGPGAVDITLFPSLCLLERALNKEEAKAMPLSFADWRQRYTNLAAWHQRMHDWPGVAETYPPHWSE